MTGSSGGASDAVAVADAVELWSFVVSASLAASLMADRMTSDLSSCVFGIHLRRSPSASFLFSMYATLLSVSNSSGSSASTLLHTFEDFERRTHLDSAGWASSSSHPTQSTLPPRTTLTRSASVDAWARTKTAGLCTTFQCSAVHRVRWSLKLSRGSLAFSMMCTGLALPLAGMAAAAGAFAATPLAVEPAAVEPLAAEAPVMTATLGS
mmetsp:Transcript_95535/g.270470  ORF Transcript_95535/g.270470 Transcript_95535/m.270470 type:complete len:209 (-) Transcript_95535:429-1055(-)